MTSGEEATCLPGMTITLLADVTGCLWWWEEVRGLTLRPMPVEAIQPVGIPERRERLNLGNKPASIHQRREGRH